MYVCGVQNERQNVQRSLAYRIKQSKKNSNKTRSKINKGSIKPKEMDLFFNKYKIMKMKNNIFDLIKNDLVLRQKIATAEGVTDSSVRLLCIRKSPKLTEFNILKIIKTHTGLKDKDIFEKK